MASELARKEGLFDLPGGAYAKRAAGSRSGVFPDVLRWYVVTTFHV